jgi:hypothetical protein
MSVSPNLTSLLEQISAPLAFDCGANRRRHFIQHP